MSYSYTTSATKTFTLTQAKYLAGKVVSDMDRCQQIYGRPYSSEISAYHEELVVLLNSGYVESYEFGYEIEDTRVVSWKYKVAFGDLAGGNDSPGRLYRKADVSLASFFNYLTRSSKWWQLSDTERENFHSSVPIRRTAGNERRDGNGYWKDEKTYSATGCLVTRSSFVPFS